MTYIKGTCNNAIKREEERMKNKIFEGMCNEDAAELSLYIGDTYFAMPNKFWDILLESISKYKDSTCKIGEVYRKIDGALKLYKGMELAFSIIKDERKKGSIWYGPGWRRKYQEEFIALSEKEQKQKFIDDFGLKEEDFQERAISYKEWFRREVIEEESSKRFNNKQVKEYNNRRKIEHEDCYGCVSLRQFGKKEQEESMEAWKKAKAKGWLKNLADPNPHIAECMNTETPYKGYLTGIDIIRIGNCKCYKLGKKSKQQVFEEFKVTEYYGEILGENEKGIQCTAVHRPEEEGEKNEN